MSQTTGKIDVGSVLYYVGLQVGVVRASPSCFYFQGLQYWVGLH